MALTRFTCTLRKHSIFTRLILARYACTRMILARYVLTGFTCTCAPVYDMCRVYLYMCSYAYLSSSQVHSSCYSAVPSDVNEMSISTRMILARWAWYMPAMYYEVLLHECHCCVHRSSRLSTLQLLVHSSCWFNVHGDVCCSSWFLLKIPVYQHV